MNGKTKVVATLATAGVLVLAPVTAQLEGSTPSIQAGDAQASAATIDVLKDSKLDPVYENGKLKLTLTGKQLAHIGLIANYYTYFALPPELAHLLDNPDVRANTTLSYDIPVLSVGSIGVPSNQGSVTGEALTLDKEHQAIGAKIHHGLASVGIGATNTYTLTIDLANLGLSSLPSSEDSQLEFAAMSSDEDIDLNLLGNQHAAQSTLETSQPDMVKPVINADDQELAVGETFQPKEGVTATDDRDGDVTNEVEVVENNVDTSKAGTYTVTYQVKDQAGNMASKTITVTVVQPDTVKPVIEASDQTLAVGEEFDPKAGVKATDDQDGDVTNQISVVENDVDSSTVGTYHVTYQVKDQAGNVATKTITVTVKDNGWQDFQVGNVIKVKPIAPEASVIEGETDYSLSSEIPKGTKIYANAMVMNDSGFGRYIGRAEINYGKGYFTIPITNPSELQAGEQVNVYLTAENGSEQKTGKAFTTQVSSSEAVPF